MGGRQYRMDSAPEFAVGDSVQYRIVGMRDGLPLIESDQVENAPTIPHLGLTPGNGRSTGNDPEIDGEKYNSMIEHQPQVQSRPIIGVLPDRETSVRTVQKTSIRTAQTDEEKEGDESVAPSQQYEESRREFRMAPSKDWNEGTIDDMMPVGDLLLIKINGQSYLIIYDDICRRAGIGPGAKISFRIMPDEASNVPGMGKIDAPRVQLGTVLVPAPHPGFGA